MKIRIVIVMFLLPLTLQAQNLFDVKASYSRMGYSTIGSGGGYNLGAGMYQPLYEDEDFFIRNFAIGAVVDYSTALANGVWLYNVIIGPEFRLEMPYSFLKLGFGYDYWKVKGLSSVGAVGVKFSGGGLIDIDENTKVGLDITFACKASKGFVSIFSFGPVFAMKI